MRKILFIFILCNSLSYAETFKDLERLYLRNNLSLSKKKATIYFSEQRLDNYMWNFVPSVDFSGTKNKNTTSKKFNFDLSIINSTKLYNKKRDELTLKLDKIYYELELYQVRSNFCYSMYFYNKYSNNINKLENMLFKMKLLKTKYFSLIDNQPEKMQFLKFLYDIQNLLYISRKEYLNFEKILKKSHYDISVFKNKDVGINIYELKYDKQDLMKKNNYFEITKLKSAQNSLENEFKYGNNMNLGVRYSLGKNNNSNVYDVELYFKVDLYKGIDSLFLSNKKKEHTIVKRYENKIAIQDIFLELDSKIDTINSNMEMYNNINTIFLESKILYDNTKEIEENVMIDVQRYYSHFLNLKRKSEFENIMIKDLLFVYQYLMKENPCYLIK